VSSSEVEAQVEAAFSPPIQSEGAQFIRRITQKTKNSPISQTCKAEASLKEMWWSAPV